MVGPGDPILTSVDPTNSVDYEGELGVVIGPGGRGISEEDALDHVYGYTVINDVTARTLQHRHKQWFISKGLDSFCPTGPVGVRNGYDPPIFLKAGDMVSITIDPIGTLKIPVK